MIHSSENIKRAQTQIPACRGLEEAIAAGQWTVGRDFLNTISNLISDERLEFPELTKMPSILNSRELGSDGGVLERPSLVELIFDCVSFLNFVLDTHGQRRTIDFGGFPPLDSKLKSVEIPVSFYFYKGIRYNDPFCGYSQVLSSRSALGYYDIQWALAAYFEMIGFILSLPKDKDPLRVAVAKRKQNSFFDELILGRFSSVSFNRTLRIPDDGKTYPLPAGLGRFPIHRVEDFADRVPPSWLNEGGFFLPLYQREALFLQFEGAKWHPSITKVCVGRVNAVSGTPYTEKLGSHIQDYVVIPEQKWLDGINSGNGSVQQFVAMPLGQGYTIEAQITDEEKFGGFQLVFFDAVKGRFPDRDPAIDARMRRLEEERKRRRREGEEVGGALYSSPSFSLREVSLASASSSLGMGIAAGGKLKQSIHPDTYGVESWDSTCCGKITIHLVNSVDYKAITGEDPPPSPISAAEYQKAGIPWYHHFEEALPPVKAPSVFKKILSIAAIDKRRGKTSQSSEPPLEITPDLIRRIKTPDVNEASESYRSRAHENVSAQRWKAALREISFVIDWNSDVKADDFAVRSCCNYHLSNYLDGWTDGSLGLEKDPESVAARSWRANCLLALGDHEGLREDAEELLGSPTTELLGLEFRAEAFLLSGRYHDEIYDALSLRKREPDHARAEQILSEARLKAYEQHKGS